MDNILNVVHIITHNLHIINRKAPYNRVLPIALYIEVSSFGRKLNSTGNRVNGLPLMGPLEAFIMASTSSSYNSGGKFPNSWPRELRKFPEANSGDPNRFWAIRRWRSMIRFAQINDLRWIVEPEYSSTRRAAGGPLYMSTVSHRWVWK